MNRKQRRLLASNKYRQTREWAIADLIRQRDEAIRLHEQKEYEKKVAKENARFYLRSLLANMGLKTFKVSQSDWFLNNNGWNSWQRSPSSMIRPVGRR